MKTRNWILWTDCLGGLFVGLLVLLVHRLLSQLEGLPRLVVISMGIANLIYGSYSLFVTTRTRRPIVLIRVLAIANVIWLFVCVAILFLWFDTVTVFGMILILGEGIYVAALGLAEWRWQISLATQQSGLQG
ncbi:MAG: hypothetical protein KDB22_25345 [Planctomycetales bacterium]|nr:hypothetical protein [Planctomycetales bacterium]